MNAATRCKIKRRTRQRTAQRRTQMTSFKIGVGDEEEKTVRFFNFIPLQFCVFGFGPSFLAIHHLS